MANWMDDRVILTRLRKLIQDAGSQKNLAANLGFTSAYICQVLQERMPVSDNLARALGFEVKRVARKIKG